MAREGSEFLMVKSTLRMLARKLCGFGYLKYLRKTYSDPLNRGSRVRLTRQFVLWFFLLKPLSKSMIVELQNGMRTVVYPDSDSGVSNVFTRNVDFLDNEFVRSRLSTGDFIVDAGCNVGNRTLVLADLLSGALLLDANPICLDRAKYNFELNNLESERFVMVCKAVGARHGNVAFSSLGGSSCQNHIIDTEVKNCDDVTFVTEMTTIDEEIAKIGNPNCSFIKFDLEGHDLAGLEGAVNTLQNNNVRLVKFERWRSLELKPFMDFFQRIGWRVFTLNKSGVPDYSDDAILSSPDLFAEPIL